MNRKTLLAQDIYIYVHVQVLDPAVQRLSTGFLQRKGTIT